jgi:hypothetical protein
MKGLIKIIPEKINKDAQYRTVSVSPAQYHFNKYYTQDPDYKLFHAMRYAIKKQCAIMTLGGNCGLWEVCGERAYVFITNKAYALRAQEILIKWIGKKNENFKYTAYHFCTDLDEKKWHLKSGYNN